MQNAGFPLKGDCSDRRIREPGIKSGEAEEKEASKSLTFGIREVIINRIPQILQTRHFTISSASCRFFQSVRICH